MSAKRNRMTQAAKAQLESQIISMLKDGGAQSPKSIFMRMADRSWMKDGDINVKADHTGHKIIQSMLVNMRQDGKIPFESIVNDNVLSKKDTVICECCGSRYMPK